MVRGCKVVIFPPITLITSSILFFIVYWVQYPIIYQRLPNPLHWRNLYANMAWRVPKTWFEHSFGSAGEALHFSSTYRHLGVEKILFFFLKSDRLPQQRKGVDKNSFQQKNYKSMFSLFLVSETA